MKNKALRYYLEGDYSVIPLGGDKRPVVASWVEHQTSKADESQINAWWKVSPKANIGIVTGKISGITVVDVDNGKADGRRTSIDMFPPTYTVKTPSGGYHLYYAYEPSVRTSANAYPQFPHVDIRNDGGYVVAAGSVTSYEEKGVRKGGEYVVERDVPIVAFPLAMFGATLATGAPSKAKERKRLVDLMAVAEGDGRNNMMASFIGKMLAVTPKSKWDSEVLTAAVAANHGYKPPMDNDELVSIYNSICAKESKRLEGEIEAENDEEAEIITAFKRNTVKGTYMLAMYIVKRHSIITTGEVEKECYVYRDGMYRRAENEVINPEVQRILKNLVTKTAKLETTHKIHDATFMPRAVFNSAPTNLIPLRNGVYDTEKDDLLPHSPDYHFTFQFPIVYDKSAKCPKSLAFVDQVLLGWQATLVQEWLGYYFLRSYMFKKAIIFVGEGDTGKTTLLEMITFLLGKENIASVPLQKMASDKFAGAHMYEKHGNLVDELSARDVSDTGNFKIATGGGSITGEYKFGNQFAFVNFAKLTFACNRIPDVQEMDDTAYFNRWMVVRFMNRIERKIPNFIATIATEEERSGLFNHAMEGLRRLLRNGRFTYDKDAEQTKMEMLMSGSSIAQFAANEVCRSYGSEISKDDMYDAYLRFCEHNDGFQVETMDNFGKKFGLYASYASDGTMNARGEYDHAGRPRRVRAWRNVALIRDIEESKESDKDMEKLVGELSTVAE